MMSLIDPSILHQILLIIIEFTQEIILIFHVYLTVHKNWHTIQK